MKGLNILRIGFVVVCAFLGWEMGEVLMDTASLREAHKYGSIIGAAIGMILIAAEIGFTRRYLGIVASVIFGLLGGLMMSVLFVKLFLLLPVVEYWANEDAKILIQVASLVVFSYLSVILVLQSRENFKFIIPFIQLQKEGEQIRDLVLDTSVIIDGRILDICRTGLIKRTLIVPRFVLAELHTLSDSADKTKRSRGRRGLEMLDELRQSSSVTVEVRDVKIPYVDEVDQKLIRYAKAEQVDIISNDYNLNKVASVEGINVININDLAKALKQRALPGETLTIEIVKSGEEEGQGVGYLEDGTMVVVEGGNDYMNEEINVEVTSTIQTSAGRMIFAEPA